MTETAFCRISALGLFFPLRAPPSNGGQLSPCSGLVTDPGAMGLSDTLSLAPVGFLREDGTRGEFGGSNRRATSRKLLPCRGNVATKSTLNMKNGELGRWANALECVLDDTCIRGRIGAAPSHDTLNIDLPRPYGIRHGRTKRPPSTRSVQSCPTTRYSSTRSTTNGRTDTSGMVAFRQPCDRLLAALRLRSCIPVGLFAALGVSGFG